MKCPKCGTLARQETIDSRERFRGWIRVRQCTKCHFRYKTNEQLLEEENTRPKTKRELNVERVRRMAEQMQIKLMED